MDDETQPPFPPNSTEPTAKSLKSHSESNIGGLSVRSVIVVVVVFTVCVMSFMDRKVREPLYTLVGLTVGYYFGQNQRPTTTTVVPDKKP